MKTVVFAPAALARLSDILAYTVERFGKAQAETYAARLAGWLEALASGKGPKARPCERLMRDVRESSGLVCYHEGAHYLILREAAGNTRSRRDIPRADEHRGAPGAADAGLSVVGARDGENLRWVTVR